MQKRSRTSLAGKMIASKDRFYLPVQLTSFVGREQEIVTVCRLLRRPEIRLLTLTGTGGVGKTRLGLQIATRLTRDFAGQVCFISLMETSDPERVLPTIAKRLGLQEPGKSSILERLKAFLRERRLLLLLDNFEQIIEAAPMLADLLGACAGLKILITSRTVLQVSGEHTYFVSPLELPNPEQLPAKKELLRYSSITLFLERARAVLYELSQNEEDMRTIAKICISLDGLPLAIELAVSCLKLLSPQALLGRLDHRFQALTYGRLDAPPERQLALQNTMEWSYRLSDPAEQQLFRYLSLFIGGCTFHAVEAIWELTGHQHEKELVLERVVSLLDKNMLYRSNQDAEEPRLSMLRTIREYGLHLLTLTGEMAQIQWIYVTYYLTLAETIEPELKGPQPRLWLERLQREHGNLREALCTLIAHGGNERRMSTEMALRLGKALERFWIIGGHVKEGRDLLERALKKSLEVSPAIRGHALCVVSTLARYQGDLRYAVATGEESLAIFRELGDPAGITASLHRLGYIAWMQGDPTLARLHYEEGLAVSHQAEQRKECREARSDTLYYFALMALFQRDARTARPLIEECLALCREREDQYNTASALNILGWIAFLQGDITTAHTLQKESLAASRELGNQRGQTHALHALGEIASRMGNYTQACDYYEESLEIIMRLDDSWAVAVYLEGQARVAIALNEVIWAVHLLSAAEALRQNIGAPTATPLEKGGRTQALATLHERMDEHFFAAAWARGQSMSPKQAVAARNHFTPAVSQTDLEKQTMQTISSPPLHHNLTTRERDVLRLVALGLTDAQVAERLVISPRTVSYHLTSVYRKLQVPTRSAATRYALESHLF